MGVPRPSAHDVPAIVYAMMAERWEDWPDQKEIK
jgi:hypothetical protein